MVWPISTIFGIVSLIDHPSGIIGQQSHHYISATVRPIATIFGMTLHIDHIVTPEFCMRVCAKRATRWALPRVSCLLYELLS